MRTAPRKSLVRRALVYAETTACDSFVTRATTRECAYGRFARFVCAETTARGWFVTRFVTRKRPATASIRASDRA